MARQIEDKATVIFQSPWGNLQLRASATGICYSGFSSSSEVLTTEEYLDVPQLLITAIQELREYGAGTRRAFTVPLDLGCCSNFTHDILTTLLKVPFGTTISYGDLARVAGHPGAARAVGRVMAGNFLAILIPCHRVVGSDQRLVGYSGGNGIDTKLQLLRHEGAWR